MATPDGEGEVVVVVAVGFDVLLVELQLHVVLVLLSVGQLQSEEVQPELWEPQQVAVLPRPPARL